jgi:hypothetical protein
VGFNWDDYKGGGNYISAAEKKALADSGMPFTVTAVRGPIEKGFEKPAMELDITVPNPEGRDDEERCLSFAYGSGAESRDRMLAGLKAYFKGVEAVAADPENGIEAVAGVAPGDPVTAKVIKVGRAYFLEPAEAA